MKMLLYFNLFIVYFLFNIVEAKKSFYTLDIDNYDKEHFKIKSIELDNVYYDQFTPIKKFSVKTIDQSGNKIWKSDGIGTCEYSLLSKLHKNPYLLYIKVDRGYTDEHLYYIKKDDMWTSIDIYEYSNLINELKKDIKIEKYISLNISSCFSNDSFEVEYASAGKPYTYFTPNVGFLATRVLYNTIKLWEAENKGDRCVAAWAYMYTGSYYMIRLLITKLNEESQLKTYFIIKNKWQLVHILEHNYDSKEYVKRPEDFLYPNYTFNLKPVNNHKITNVEKYDIFSEGKKLPNVSETNEYLDYMEGKYYSSNQNSNTNEVKYDIFSEGKKLPNVSETNEYLDYMEGKYYSSNQNSNTNEVKYDIFSEGKKLPNVSETNEYLDYMEGKYSSNQNSNTNEVNEYKQDSALEPLNPNNYQPNVKFIRKNDCLQLDVSKRLHNFKYENMCIFDKYLQVVTYNPPPGKYFDLVKDGIEPLFVGHRLHNICQSVNFYLKNGDFYLCEVIVRTENKDSTRHFKKVDNKWHYTDINKFLDTLNELKNSLNE